MRMLTPSHAKKVQRYKDDIIPLYHRYQVETQMESINSPVVQLRSGGSIVFAQTEALVAIDVNSGRATKERHIEETAFKTNMEAAEEIARQLRLRDLAGLIVIDFIDMEDNRNNHAVERKLKEALKADRARIQVGRISHFGLLELSRQRLRPSLIEANFRTCSHCAGTGMIRSTESAAVHSLRMLEEEGVRQRSSEVTITVHPDVALYLLNYKREALASIEARYGIKIFVLGDAHLIPPNLRLDRVKAMRGEGQEVRELPQQPVREIAPPEPEEEVEAEDPEDEDEASAGDTRSHAQPRGDGHTRGDGEEDGGRRKRRRKRRRGRGGEDRGDGFRHDRPEGPRHDGQRHEGQRHDGQRPEFRAEPRAEGEQSAEGTEGGQDGQPRSEGQEGRPEHQGRDGEGRRRRRGRRGGRRRRRGNGEPGGEHHAGDHQGGEHHGGEHPPRDHQGGDHHRAEPQNGEPRAVEHQGFAGNDEAPRPAAVAPAPAVSTSEPAGEASGQSRSFFRAIKEGVLGRPTEQRAAEPPRAEPRPEPVQAPAPQPQPEPEPSGPPRKGWWSNKT
jgi:ribonuclease E